MKGCESKLRIIVLGYIVRGPMAGMAWHHLQYVAGLARLGHDVYFVEDSDDYDSCYHPATELLDRNPAYGLRFATRVFAKVQLADRWTYFDAHEQTWLGPARGVIRDVLQTADILFNVSGVNPMRPWFSTIPTRVLIDTDPVFTQIRHLTDPTRRRLAESHTAFFSFGENLVAGTTSIPNDGFAWHSTRQPIVLDLWPVQAPAPQGKFTTVMQWDSYEPVHWNCTRYGMKREMFTPFLDFPRKAEGEFEMVVSGPAPREKLCANGWTIRKPHAVTGDPWTYQRYIQRSKAEFSVAKQGYIAARSGWFSERSACYLASGRPVIVQDTGFTDWLKANKGVVAFRTADEALAGVESVNTDYRAHCEAAREIAVDYFDSTKVLDDLLARATSTPADAL